MTSPRPRPSRLRAEHLDDPIGIDVRRPRLVVVAAGGGVPTGGVPSPHRRRRAGPGRVERARARAVADRRPPCPANGDLGRSGSGATGAPTAWSAPGGGRGRPARPVRLVGVVDRARRRRRSREPGRRPAPVLRHEFVLDRPVERARLYATAHGIYEAFLGGTRVGDLELTPGTTSYPTRLQVQTHDVTALLHEGDNELQVVLVATAGGAARRATGATTTATARRWPSSASSTSTTPTGPARSWRPTRPGPGPPGRSGGPT